MLDGDHDAAAVIVRLLQADEPGGGPVHVGVGMDVLLHLLEVEGAVRGVEDAQLHLAESRSGGLLVEDDMGLGVKEDLVAALGEGADRRLVAHGATGKVEARVLARQPRPFAATIEELKQDRECIPRET